MSDNNKYTYSWRKYLEQPEEDNDKLPDIVELFEQQGHNENTSDAYDDFIESLLSEQAKSLRVPGRVPGKTTRKPGFKKKTPKTTFKRKPKPPKPGTVTRRKTRLDPKKPKPPKKTKLQNLKDRLDSAGRIAKYTTLAVGATAAAACIKGAIDAPRAADPMLGPLGPIVAYGGGCLDAVKGVYTEVFGEPQTAVEKEMAQLKVGCFQRLLNYIYNKKEFTGDDRLEKLKKYKVTAADMKAAGCPDCDDSVDYIEDGQKKNYNCVSDMQKMWDNTHATIDKDGQVNAANFIQGLAPYIAYDIAKSSMSSGIDMAGGFLLDIITKYAPAAVGALGALAGGAALLLGRNKAKNGKNIPQKMAKNSTTPNGKSKIAQINQANKNRPKVRLKRENIEVEFPILEIIDFGVGGDYSPSNIVAGSMIDVNAKAVADQLRSAGIFDGKVSSILYAIYIVQLFAEDPFDWKPMDMELFKQQADSELERLGEPLIVQEFLRGVDMSDGTNFDSTGKKYSLSDLGGDLSGEVVNLEKFGIQHNLTGAKKTTAEKFINQLYNLGITNKYSLAGALAVMGKESGFKGVEEGSWYSYDFLVHGYRKNRKTGEIKNKDSAKRPAVGNRIASIFRKQLGREPLESEWEQLSSDKSGKKAGIAMFNIAYGYSPNQNVPAYGIKPITMPVLKGGRINPDLFDANLPGYKYRGRGPIQNTFAQNYAATAKKAGLPVDKILEDPGLLYREPAVGAAMSAGFIRNVLSSKYKLRNGMTKRQNLESQFGFDADNPTTLEQGIMLHAAIAGGGGGRDLLISRWFKRAVRNAKAAAAKYIRVIEEPSSGSTDVS